MGSDAGEAGAPLRAMLGDELAGKVVSSKILVVGAGGIGCELLKSLVMTGFSNIDVVCVPSLFSLDRNRVSRVCSYGFSTLRHKRAG